MQITLKHNLVKNRLLPLLQGEDWGEIQTL